MLRHWLFLWLSMFGKSDSVQYHGDNHIGRRRYNVTFRGVLRPCLSSDVNVWLSSIPGRRLLLLRLDM
jgi:hypothetical protein